MKLYHGDKLLGEIVTNHSMTIDYALEMLGIDVNETDGNGDLMHDYEAIHMVYED